MNCARQVFTRTRDFTGHPCKFEATKMVNGGLLCSRHAKQALAADPNAEIACTCGEPEFGEYGHFTDAEGRTYCNRCGSEQK